MSSLNVLDCDAKAHSATSKNSPAAQTVWPSDAPFRQAPQRLVHNSLKPRPGATADDKNRTGPFYYDIIVPELPEGYQPLHAVYSRNCLPNIKRLLLLDKLKITGFYRDMRVLTIGEEKIKPFNEDGRLFQNLNTPDDMEKVQGARIKEQG